MKKLSFIRRWVGEAISLIVLLVALSVAGCAAQRGPAAVPSADPTSLVIAVPKGDVAQALQAAAKDYTAESGQSVRVEALGTEAYLDQVSAVLLSGQARYDLVYLPADSLARWAAYKAIRPAPEGLDTRPLSPWLPVLTVTGKLYGVPTNPDPLVLWYRTDLLAQAPSALKDWQSVAQAAQGLKASASADFYPLALAGSELDGGRDFAAVLAGFGAPMVSDAYQVNVDGDSARQSLQYLVGLVRSGLAAPDSGQMTQADVVKALAQGKAALGLAPLSAGQQLLDCTTGSKVCQGGKPLLNWNGLPGQDKTAAQGELSAWVVPLHAPHASAAEGFAAWLAGEKGAQSWAKNGGVPAHQGVLAAMPAVNSSDGKTSALTTQDANRLANLKTYRLVFPPAPNAEQLWSAINPIFHNALTNEQPPDEILSKANDVIRRALRQDGLLQ